MLARGARAGAARLLREIDIENTCTEWLTLDGWRPFKTDPKHLRGLGVTEPGMPDRFYVRYLYRSGGSAEPCMCGMRDGCACVQLVWIEWKRKGGKSALRQMAWHDAERLRGAVVLVAGENFPATIEGFQHWYRQSGLMRRKI